MGITAEQLEARVGGVGSSDAAAVCGLYPWAGPSDVYWTKQRKDDGKPLVKPSHSTSLKARLGEKMEADLVEIVSEDLVAKFGESAEVIDQAEAWGENGISVSHLDRKIVINDMAYGIEAKVTGLDKEYWQTATGGYEMPDFVNCQCQHHFYCHPDLQFITVIVLFPKLVTIDDEGRERSSPFDNYDIRTFPVFRNERDIKAIIACEEKFWNEHVVPGIPPEDLPKPDVFAHIDRTPKKEYDIDPDLWAEFTAAKAKGSAAKEQADALRVAILAVARDASILEFGSSTHIGRITQKKTAHYGTGVDYIKDCCPHCGVGKKESKSIELRQVKRPAKK